MIRQIESYDENKRTTPLCLSKVIEYLIVEESEPTFPKCIEFRSGPTLTLISPEKTKLLIITIVQLISSRISTERHCTGVLHSPLMNDC